MAKIVVLDTNVLLADPNSVLSFPRAEVVIPETVLGELDKLKTARVDPDLRFRGREVSRMLFELSEDGSLIDGVDIPDGGRLRVATLDSDVKLPEGMSTRNPDDRILATAFQVCSASGDDCEVQLVTNDLNMLLKAQTLGVNVVRYGEGVEGGFAKRYIIRPFQRYRVPITILAVAVAVFAAVIAIAVFTTRQNTSTSAALPAEFKAVLSAKQLGFLDALIALQTNPGDPEALLAVANYYFDTTEAARAAGDQASAFKFAQQGIRYFERYLKQSPQDLEARADLASLRFYTGSVDEAIRDAKQILGENPNHINANYNLGIFYWQKGSPDFEAAAGQMRKVIKLTETDPQQHSVSQQAQAVLGRVLQDAQAAGRPIEATQGATQ
jgi:Flp pilus assembly protein TadD